MNNGKLSLIKFVIRPTSEVSEEGQLPGVDTHGIGVLQSIDLKKTLAESATPIFVNYHFNENRLNYWLGKPMVVIEVRDTTKTGKASLCGSYITDGDANLIAFCYDNENARLARGNRQRMQEVIVEKCNPKSITGKF